MMFLQPCHATTGPCRRECRRWSVPLVSGASGSAPLWRRAPWDEVRHGRALPPAWPRSDFPPLCLSSLGRLANLRSSTTSLPLASAGCSSSLERFTSAAPLPAPQHRWPLHPPHQLGGLDPSHRAPAPLPLPQPELVGQLGSIQERGLLWWTSRSSLHRASAACSQASWHPLGPGRAAAACWSGPGWGRQGWGAQKGVTGHKSGAHETKLMPTAMLGAVGASSCRYCLVLPLSAWPWGVCVCPCALLEWPRSREWL